MVSNVDRIKERLDIVDVIGNYVKLEKAGKNWKGRSPFTNEKTPSFFVSTEKQLYHCFSSGKGGDIFTFVEEVEGVDFKGALKILAERAGVELVVENKKEKDERDRLYEVLEKATVYFEGALAEDANAKKYIVSRGISKESITRWRIGYAPDSWRGLKEHLVKGGYTEQELLRTGLIKKTDEAKESYDVFRGRIMFPIADNSGRVVGFSGRILVPNDKSPKYLNSPDTELFNKSKVLYGLHLAKTAVRKLDYAVLVEGQMDLVMSHQAGVSNTVAGSGTAITEDHLKILQKISNRVVIAFDSDRAGFTASNRSAGIALALGMDVKATLLPPGLDPADIIREKPELWREALRNSSHIIDFYVENLLMQQVSPLELKKEVKKQVLPYLLYIQSSIEQSHYISRISERTNIPETALWEDLKQIPLEKKSEYVFSNTAERSILTTEEFVKALLVSDEGEFDRETIRKEIERIAGTEYVQQVLHSDDTDKQKLIFAFQAYLSREEKPLLPKEIDDVIRRFEIEILKAEFGEINRKRANAESIGEVDRAEAYLKEQFDIRKKIDKLLPSH